MFESNPFSTRYIAPGAIHYECLSSDTDVNRLVEDFCKELPNHASIIGPHGTGKSTLIATMLPLFKASMRFPQVESLRVSSDGNADRQLRQSLQRIHRNGLFVIDGYEQLGAISRWLVRAWCWLSKASTLITAHAPISTHRVLWTTSVTPETELLVLKSLLKDSPTDTLQELLNSPEWNASRQRHGDNLRESLFDMYDWWQDKQRCRSNCG